MQPASATGTIQLTQVMDNCRIGRLQIRVFALCLASLVMDGFDVQAMGFVATSLFAEWRTPNTALGGLLAWGNGGVLVGAIAFSMLADRIGRRPVLVWATLFYALMTMATAFAQDVEQMRWLRFIAGIGLGSIIPNATALVGEYSPKRTRVAWIMCITVGFTAGAAIGGLVANLLIGHFGWRAVFVFGGAVPAVIALLMLLWLPESLQFLAVRGRRPDELARRLKELDATLRITPQTRFETGESARRGVPFWHLFREGRASATLLFWVVNFANILVLYSLAGWLPLIFQNLMGYERSTAILLGTVVQVGGTFGTLGLAWLNSRMGLLPMLTLTFAVAAISVAMIGQPGWSLPALYAIVFIAGWCIVGGQPGLNALSSSYYPTYLRSTGVGAGLGVGRLGAIVGPVIGNSLIAAQWAPQQLLWAAAVPAVLSTAVMIALWMLIGRRAASGGAPQETFSPGSELSGAAVRRNRP